MKRSRRGVAAVFAMGAACAGLVLGTVALAQQEAPAEPEGPDGREALNEIVEVRAEGNDEAAAVQQRVETISDETDSLLSQYRTALKQIDAIDLYNSQMRTLIAAQGEELASLADQLDRVELVGRSVTPLMLLMIEGIEEFVRLDVPFLIEERTKRVVGLQKLMGRPDVTTAEKFRQIMEAYQIENEYGRTIEAYRSTIVQGGRETTVDFLRFGRIALVYQSLDESEAGVWSQETREWIPLDSSYTSSIRQGLRIARKQAAPDLITLPLSAPVDAKRAS